MIAVLVLVGILVFGGLIVVGMFNRLVSLRNQFKNAFSQIDVQLKRRYDLIPNIVETAKGYLKHESQTLEAVIAARNQAVAANKSLGGDASNPEAFKKMMAAESGLQGSLGRLMVVSEQYPDLKANATMASVMEELRSTENRIAFARQAYNDSVMSYNTSRESFPNSMVAGFGGFLPATSFEITESKEREAVKVSF